MLVYFKLKRSKLYNKMNLIFTPSLEQRALANIAIALWSQNDVQDLMSKSALHTLRNKWPEIENVVIQKLFKLLLPEKLKVMLLGFIVRVGFQLLSWIDLHHCKHRFVTQLPATFVWTSLGTINDIKTATLLLMGGTLDDDKSFALACMYCLVEEMKYYWNNSSFNVSKFDHVCFKMSWCYVYKLHLSEMLMPHSSVTFTPHMAFLKEAVESGNEIATRYFFNENLKDTECYTVLSARLLVSKLHNLENVMFLQRYSGVMLFLLSKMKVSQQTIIQNYTYAFLKCLLVWPWHNLFLEIVKDMWNSLAKSAYNNLLYNMVIFMRYEYNLHEVFEEFWQQSPEAYKQFVTDQDDIVYLLINLYKIGDEKNVKLILKDSSISTKKKILEMGSKPIFVYLVSSKKWDSIEFLIQECLSSQEDLIRFRHVFKIHVPELLSENEFWKNYSEYEFIEKFQWDKFFQLVDDYIFRFNTQKRRCTEYNNVISSIYHWCKGIEE